MTSTSPSPRAANRGEFADLWEALASQYAVERELGRGGMGAVYLARDVRLERYVAIKVLPPHLAADGDVRERFLREARTAGRLSHPNIVPVFRADELAGHPFFAMPFIEGENLAERVAARGALSPTEAVRYLREVAWALAYAHARNVIHRDVKPENIMIDRGSGRAIVTDFGIARVDHGPGLTREGLIVGTANYMSPEQINGETLDGRSDLYALGVVGYLLLSGRLPFSSQSVSALLVAHLTQPASPLASVADVPGPIAAVIDRCLAKERDTRYPTGESLADALEKALRMSENVAAASGVRGADARMISTRQAGAVWRRAAELQAAALEQFEERISEEPANARVDGGSATHLSTAAYPLRDVEAAAVAAGISERYVALALAELGPSPAATDDDAILRSATYLERLTTLVLGAHRRFLVASRRIPYSPGRVFPAIGRVLQAPPFDLALAGTAGPHPLDGGVLLLALPPSHAVSLTWAGARAIGGVSQLQLTIAPHPGTEGACEVTLYADVTPGIRSETISGATLIALGGVAGAGAGIAIGVKMGAAGLALAGWALGLALPALLLGALVFRAVYRRAIDGASGELARALSAIETHLRSHELFGQPSIAERPTPR